MLDIMPSPALMRPRHFKSRGGLRSSGYGLSAWNHFLVFNAALRVLTVNIAACAI
jgi:hypothetical protein